MILEFLFALGIAHASVPETFVEAQESAHISVPMIGLEGVNWDDVINGDNSTGSPITFGIDLYGPSPYTRNTNLSYKPASNTKLFTTAAALEKLGKDFRLATTISWRAVSARKPETITELTLTGSGDPTWGMPEFNETLTTRVEALADALVAQGVRAVRGPVRVQASDARWNEVQYPQGWEEEDRIYCYGALPQAFNLQNNCATYVVTGPKRGFWKEEGVPVSVTLDIKPGTRTRLRVESLDSGRIQGAAYRIFGTWRQTEELEETPEAFDSNAVVFELPVHRTDEWVRNLFVHALRDRGVKFYASRVRSADPYVRSLTHYSPTLAEILRPFNKDSINQIGDGLFKILGERFGDSRVDLLAAGHGVMAEFLRNLGSAAARRAHIKPQPGFFSDDVMLFDGSGVSRDNLVTTSAVMALLLDLRARTDFEAVWQSLPIAGVDGTLKKRMKGTAAENVLRAKTGTLRGVYNLSGFVPRFNDAGTIAEFVPFVILTKTDSAHRIEARAAQDRVGAALAAIVNTAKESLR